MIRIKHIIAIGLVALLATSCASKKKKTDGGDPGITSSELTFDPSGSDSGNIAGLSTINFPYDDSNLTSEARSQLNGNAEWIKTNSKVDVQIEGHCDERGSIEYNLALGERRAKSVKSYLVSLGVDSKRLKVISYGKEKPDF